MALEQRLTVLEKEVADLKRQLKDQPELDEKRQTLELRITNLERAYAAVRIDLQIAFEAFQENMLKAIADQLESTLRLK